MRRIGIKVAYDERVLGSGEFLHHLLEEVEERERETLRLSEKVKDLDCLAQEITKEEGFTEEALQSGSRGKGISIAWRLFCQYAVGKLGYSGADTRRPHRRRSNSRTLSVARFLLTPFSYEIESGS